ncbi:unnamed protein product, partial [Amoebophrya sp. A120]|eukprot:GSA120T00019149001.1
MSKRQRLIEDDIEEVSSSDEENVASASRQQPGAQPTTAAPVSSAGTSGFSSSRGTTSGSGSTPQHHGPGPPSAVFQNTNSQFAPPAFRPPATTGPVTNTSQFRPMLPPPIIRNPAGAHQVQSGAGFSSFLQSRPVAPSVVPANTSQFLNPVTTPKMGAPVAMSQNHLGKNNPAAFSTDVPSQPGGTSVQQQQQLQQPYRDPPRGIRDVEFFTKAPTVEEMLQQMTGITRPPVENNYRESTDSAQAGAVAAAASAATPSSSSALLVPQITHQETEMEPSQGQAQAPALPVQLTEGKSRHAFGTVGAKPGEPEDVGGGFLNAQAFRSGREYMAMKSARMKEQFLAFHNDRMGQVPGMEEQRVLARERQERDAGAATTLPGERDATGKKVLVHDQSSASYTSEIYNSRRTYHQVRTERMKEQLEIHRGNKKNYDGKIGGAELREDAKPVVPQAAQTEIKDEGAGDPGAPAATSSNPLASIVRRLAKQEERRGGALMPGSRGTDHAENSSAHHPPGTSAAASSSAAAAQRHKRRLFQGLTFWMTGRTSTLTDMQIKKMILQHGGVYEPYGMTRVSHIIAENLAMGNQVWREYKEKREKKRYKVVLPAWLEDCIRENKILPETEYLPEVLRTKTIQTAAEKLAELEKLRPPGKRKKNKLKELAEEAARNKKGEMEVNKGAADGQVKSEEGEEGESVPGGKKNKSADDKATKNENGETLKVKTEPGNKDLGQSDRAEKKPLTAAERFWLEKLDEPVQYISVEPFPDAAAERRRVLKQVLSNKRVLQSLQVQEREANRLIHLPVEHLSQQQQVDRASHSSGSNIAEILRTLSQFPQIAKLKLNVMGAVAPSPERMMSAAAEVPAADVNVSSGSLVSAVSSQNGVVDAAAVLLPSTGSTSGAGSAPSLLQRMQATQGKLLTPIPEEGELSSSQGNTSQPGAQLKLTGAPATSQHADEQSIIKIERDAKDPGRELVTFNEDNEVVRHFVQDIFNQSTTVKQTRARIMALFQQQDNGAGSQHSKR